MMKKLILLLFLTSHVRAQISWFNDTTAGHVMKVDTVPSLILLSDTCRKFQVFQKVGKHLHDQVYEIKNDTAWYGYDRSVVWLSGYAVVEYIRYGLWDSRAWVNDITRVYGHWEVKFLLDEKKQLLKNKIIWQERHNNPQ